MARRVKRIQEIGRVDLFPSRCGNLERVSMGFVGLAVETR